MLTKMKVGVIAIISLAITASCSKENISPVIADFDISGENYTIKSSIQFQNNSEGASSYIWDFGDGKTSTQVHPEHAYTLAGEYTVRLTAYSDNGVQETTKTIAVKAPVDIIEGLSIKGIRIGDSWSSISNSNELDFSAEGVSETDYGYIKIMFDQMKGLIVYLVSESNTLLPEDNDQVYLISVTTGFRGTTTKNIKLGSKIDQLLEAYGTSDTHDIEKQTYTYHKQGILFAYNNLGLVSQIAIFTPNSQNN